MARDLDHQSSSEDWDRACFHPHIHEESPPAGDELGWTAPLEGLSPLEGLDGPDPGQVTMEELLELEEPEE